MDYLNIPTWAKKYGILGLVLFIIVAVIIISIEAVVEQEAQSFWATTIRPFLAYKVSFAIPVWSIGLIVLGSATIILFFSNHTKKSSHIKHGKINPDSLLIPKSSDDNVSKSRVFRAVREARSHRLDHQDLATIVEQAANTGAIKPEIAAEILKEFGFVLLLNLDKTVTAQKQWRNE